MFTNIINKLSISKYIFYIAIVVSVAPIETITTMTAIGSVSTISGACLYNKYYINKVSSINNLDRINNLKYNIHNNETDK